ncbi:MAG: phage holin family protein [Chloroflexota bacterium]
MNGSGAETDHARLRDATSLVDLGRLLLDDAGKLVRQEVSLAKEEVIELLLTNLKGLAFVLVAAVLALVAFVMLQVAVLFTVPSGVRLYLAWSLFGLWLIATLLPALLGKRRFVLRPPEKTLETIKGDIAWAKGQLRSNGK